MPTLKETWDTIKFLGWVYVVLQLFVLGSLAMVFAIAAPLWLIFWLLGMH